jgi:hypothetical protein
VRFAVVSSLAEGIPRIAALVAIRLGASLEVILSDPPDQVSRGLSEYSRGEFRALLSAASVRTILTPQRLRYEQHRAIISRCDALIIVNYRAGVPQDTGETHEIADIAMSQQLPVIRIIIDELSEGKQPSCSVILSSMPGSLLGAELLKSIDRFNGAPIPKGAMLTLDHLIPSVNRELTIELEGKAALPYFVRADYIALRCLRAFKRYSAVVQMLTVIAVILALTQLVLLPRQEALTWAEATCLVAVVVTVWIGRLAGWYDMWQSARYLAERIRWAVVLAAAGASAPLAPGFLIRRDQPPDWVRRAFREIWLMIPQRLATNADVPQLRPIISDWLGDHIAYHTMITMRFRRRERFFRLLGTILFTVAIGLAIVHSLGTYDPLHAAPQSLGYLSVLVPLISGAIAEYSGRQNYGHRAEESVALAQELTILKHAIMLTTEINELQDYVLRSELVARPQIRQEGIKELELPT